MGQLKAEKGKGITGGSSVPKQTGGSPPVFPDSKTHRFFDVSCVIFNVIFNARNPKNSYLPWGKYFFYEISFFALDETNYRK